MGEKTLSSTTLNLRFMQNARRAQQLPQTEPEQAHVKDDAEWEVSPEIREAWGHSAYRGEKAVSYETSYLPFIFPSLHDTHAADGPSSLSPSNTLRPRGRRAFDKRGEEITKEASSPTTDSAPPKNIDQEATEQTKKSRPHSISSTGMASLTARQSKKYNKDPSKTAKNIIFDMTGVGTDLRQSSSMQGTAFLRPSGVDGPADPAKTSNPTKTAPQPSTGATNSPIPKVKRSRMAGEADKPKKKTKLTLIE
ncbi:hypothetical protein L210DRAFT_243446 [Boletus edulis BED1]|uniref:Uncharacterized protein n=1 Tax=Boletus edulis BED1 TaxID=1328754 RepID=A0AAD4GDX0_BOLED|nr:hypothetical protein L210DRAFT_243446 [Boletus edulis BED1]